MKSTWLDSTIAPANDFIDVQVKVSKSGFCYDATGTVGARIKIKVTGGNLIVQAQVDPPNIDVDIPWYCWIAGAVIGALLGGVLFGVIGGIVGGASPPHHLHRSGGHRGNHQRGRAAHHRCPQLHRAHYRGPRRRV